MAEFLDEVSWEKAEIETSPVCLRIGSISHFAFRTTVLRSYIKENSILIRDFSVIRELFGQNVNIYAACLCRVQFLFVSIFQVVHYRTSHVDQLGEFY